ncbi:MAG TPA: hypothetical protein VGT03_09175 [Candidatus Acidoferrales bacterium]|nr:hypothetical protein [Candidatus Acidoferrales bacterium]
MTTRPQPISPEAHPPIRRRPRPNLSRHARKCAICTHPRREEIDDDFFHWYSPVQIYNEYDLPSVSTLYRHAEATGLLARRRRRNLRGVAERVMENVDDAKVSGSTILRAMRIFAHVTEDGQWLEPPKESLVTHIHKFEPPAPPLPASQREALTLSEAEGRPPASVSNNSQPASTTHALEGSIENKSLSSSLEEILIGNESVSRGEPSD